MESCIPGSGTFGTVYLLRCGMGKKRKYEANPMTKEEIENLHEKILSALHQLGYHTKIIEFQQFIFWRDKAAYYIDFDGDANGYIVVWGFLKALNRPLCIAQDLGVPLRKENSKTILYPSEALQDSVSEIAYQIQRAVLAIDMDEYMRYRKDDEGYGLTASTFEVFDALDFHDWDLLEAFF